ncbi:MAG: chorismate lyase [Gammaproteobacteria bacterium]|nr:chorismate lyase [Gammaproteobacteria bacterium]
MSGYSSQLTWRNRRQCIDKKIPAEVQRWLFDSSSLTARIISRCQGNFRVHVLSQRRMTPTPDEIRVLGLRYRSQAIIRQVILYCDDTPWVYARSVIPITTLIGPLRRLANLGSRPLGEILFSDKSIVRGEVEITELKENHPHYRLTGYRAGGSIWGRRSVFNKYRKKLLVSEFFLPGML